MRHIIFSTLLLLSFSCREKTEKVKIRFLDCYVRYLSQENRSRADATFHEGDAEHAPRPTEMPGGIRYNGSDMRVIPQKGLTFTLEKSGGDPEHEFSWKNEKGEKQACKLPMPGIQDFAFEPKSIELGKPARFAFTGEPLAGNELLLFLWESTSQSPVTMQVTGTAQANYVDFPAAELAKLKPGLWSLYVVRKKVFKSTVDGIEVRGVAEFYSATKGIEVR